MDPPSARRENDFCMPFSDLGEPDKEFTRCRKVIESAFGCGGGEPGLAKWIVQEAARVPRKNLHFCVAGRLFYIGFTPYEAEDFEPYASDPAEDFEQDHSDPVYDEHEGNDAAEVHFTGKMLDGTVFASSRENETPLTFKLIQGDVMPGFTLAIASMQPGEKAIFTVPPEFAVTMSGCTASIPWSIPPNQTLRFDIELISLITDILDDQGILKKTVKFGRGNEHPCDSDEVFVIYTACLKDGTSVSNSEGVEFLLAEGFFCPAFAHAVKTMTEGEEVVLIIKPEYGFGERGRPSLGNEAAVPPDAPLHVNLQLVSWKTVSRIGKNNDILKKTPFEANKLDEYKFIRNHALVKVRLIGRLQDGTIFDRRGHDGEEPFEFIIDQGHVIDGLEEAVLTMEERDVASFTIPPQHAFGDVGSDKYQLASVPPNSSVIYEIELLSIINVDHSAMTHDEIFESACKKRKEGDHLFNSGKYFRAFRRYFEASQILQSHAPRPDGEIKEMLIWLASRSAECRIQLHFDYPSDCVHEVWRYDPSNAKARQTVARLPEASDQIDARAMHRGSWSGTSSSDEGWTFAAVQAPSMVKLKQGHKPSGRTIFVPPSSAAAAGQSQAATPATTPAVGSTRAATTASGNQSSGTARTRKAGLCSCFGFSSSSGN